MSSAQRQYAVSTSWAERIPNPTGAGDPVDRRYAQPLRPFASDKDGAIRYAARIFEQMVASGMAVEPETEVLVRRIELGDDGEIARVLNPWSVYRAYTALTPSGHRGAIIGADGQPVPPVLPD